MPREPRSGVKELCGDLGHKAKSTGQPCKNVQGMRTKHLGVGPCWKHGGNQPSAQKRWATELAQKEAVKFLNTYGANSPRAIDPLTALREELHRAAGIVAWLEEQVSQLGENEVTHLIVTNADRAEEDGRKLEVIDERANELIKLLQQERKLLVDVCKVCLGFGIAQQEIEIAKAQATVFNQTLRAILIGLGLDINKPEVVAVVKKHLAAAASGVVAAA